ncbi:hypothetical protein [Sulfurirhabdus autotrophica]|uniref:hypothetical protein n=1 Tax=Sulfurirhabdus autotrophica TaxID=1706046 RepID=UPI0016777520|nr:hypothetical protein [Sulfurirhabdus autotrophica]
MQGEIEEFGIVVVLRIRSERSEATTGAAERCSCLMQNIFAPPRLSAFGSVPFGAHCVRTGNQLRRLLLPFR